MDAANDTLTIPTDPTLPSTFSRRQTVNQEFLDTIDEIRKVKRFENFLRPPDEMVLKTAAASGTIIVINISSFRCYAFLIDRENIRALSLPGLSQSDALSRSAGRNGRAEDLSFWKCVAEPVLSELGFTATLQENDQWPRVWWVLTGPLCAIPIHAASDEFCDRPGAVLDRVVSSYTPSIKALMNSRGHKHLGNSSPDSGTNLLVCVDTLPGELNLPAARDEINLVESLLFPSDRRDPPSKKDVLAALQECKIFHFAGHATADLSDPSNSCFFLVKDGQKDPLTVKDLIGMKLHKNPPQLAYLSACLTGKTQVKYLYDEAIHVMGAFHLAGFRHVIGSLWVVGDAVSLKVARKVYQVMLAEGMRDGSISQGLHNAIRAVKVRKIAPWSCNVADG